MRSLLLLALSLMASVALAKVVWVVGPKGPLHAPEIAAHLTTMLGEEVEVVETPLLSVLAYAPDQVELRQKVLSADRLLVTPPETESIAYALLGYRALCAQRPIHLPLPMVVAAQRPVYKMSGLCNNRDLQNVARLAVATDTPLIPLPKVWQQVYTDDTFYDDKVPKTPASESYIFAAAIVYALNGEDAQVPLLAGIHEKNAKRMLESIQKGLTFQEDVLFAASHSATNAFDIRPAIAFEAVLFDGAFEHAIGDWLVKLAEADGRTLTLRYTTDTTVKTGLPCLFRTLQTRGDSPNAVVYTRPAFRDDSGVEELNHLGEILKADGARENWLPLPLAVAEWHLRNPTQPVYDGTRPTEPVAAMAAAMLYLQWTGMVVVPNRIDQVTTSAINVGYETALRARTLRGKVNAILCRPVSKTRLSFSLWQPPADDVTILFAVVNDGQATRHMDLTYDSKTYWQRQTLEVPEEGVLYWKANVLGFGQNTGARELSQGE